MNSKNATPPVKILKYIFKQKDHPEVVQDARNAGIEIHEDPARVYACACFNNTHDYNSFKEMLTQSSIA